MKKVITFLLTVLIVLVFYFGVADGKKPSGYGYQGNSGYGYQGGK